MEKGKQRADTNGGRLRHPCLRQQPADLRRDEAADNNDVTEGPKSSLPAHKTLTSQEVSVTFREHFIFTGYRLPDQPWSYYVGSLFWLHNETGNVWTHLLGCLFIVLRTAAFGLELGGFTDPRFSPVACFALGCVICNVMSATAHLLHSKSQRHHCIFFVLDDAGIAYYLLAVGIGSMYCCSHPDYFSSLDAFFLPGLLVMSWATFYMFMRSRCRNHGEHQLARKAQRILACTAASVYLLWPIAGRYVACAGDAGCSWSSLNHISVCFLSVTLAGLAFGLHFPEKLWPVRFDIWGQGHQWFHVLINVTQELQLRAIHEDLVTRGRGHDSVGNLGSLLLVFAVLGLAVACTIWIHLPDIDAKIQETLAAERQTQQAGEDRKRQ